MPLVSTVGRRSLSTRLLLGGMYALLTVGAVTMLYPFGLMFSMATTSRADSESFRLVPRDWFDQRDLFMKYMVDAAKVNELAVWFGQDKWFNVKDTEAEQMSHVFGAKPQHRRRVADDWRRFVTEVCPAEFKLPLFTAGGDDSPFALRTEYMNWLEQRYETVDAANAAYVDTATTWYELGMHPPLLDRQPHDDQRSIDWQQFIQSRAPQRTGVLNVDAIVFDFLSTAYGNAARLAEMTGFEVDSLTAVTYDDLWSGRLGRDPKREFFMRHAPLRFLSVDVQAAQSEWHDYLAREKKQRGTPLTPRMPHEPDRAGAWGLFVSKSCPLEALDIDRPDTHWRRFLRDQYADVSALNDAYGTNHAGFEDASLSDAMALAQVDAFKGEQSSIWWQYLVHNFVVVIGFVAIHGQALQVTAIYIVLLVATTLTINPLAAYALSRFRLKQTHHVLVFLLATMAFPGEVLMIPSFFLIKSFPLLQVLFVALSILAFALLRTWLGKRLPLLPSAAVAVLITGFVAGWGLPALAARFDAGLSVNLLNTFWALVLPGLANGYGIFLLKGFFDSLPAELYESGVMDGAGELRMFWRITMPLCKPILAVMALGAFTAAYGAFMHAFLVCQDPRMWTLMVFLYEFQQTHTVPLVMASLVVAAVPTLIVFILCQRVILRGIVIPTFK